MERDACLSLFDDTADYLPDLLVRVRGDYQLGVRLYRRVGLPQKGIKRLAEPIEQHFSWRVCLIVAGETEKDRAKFILSQCLYHLSLSRCDVPDLVEQDESQVLEPAGIPGPDRGGGRLGEVFSIVEFGCRLPELAVQPNDFVPELALITETIECGGREVSEFPEG